MDSSSPRPIQVTLREGDELSTWVAPNETIAWAKIASEIVQRIPNIEANWGIDPEQAELLRAHFASADYAELAELANDITNGELWFTVDAADFIAQAPTLPSPDQFAATLGLDPIEPEMEIDLAPAP